MSSDLSSDLIHGKRKRSDSEFDSDTESVGNNFPGQNMDFSYEICGKVMTEFAKARLKMDPYSTIGGWSDPHLWSTLMRVVDPFNSPNMRDNIMEIIFMFEQLFLQKRVYEVTDDELCINMYTVFGPGSDGDAGSLRTCNLDCNLLAIRRLHSDEVPPTTLQCDVDDVGQCVVQDGGGPSNSDHIRKKAKTTTFTAPSEYEYLYNPNSPSVPPRNFEKSVFSILSRNDMLELYRDSTKHLTPDDRGLFLFYVAPGDITFQTLAMSPVAKRKDIVDSMVKKIKDRKSSHHPTYYLSHHPQGKTLPVNVDARPADDEGGWRPAPSGLVKINVDARVKEGEGRSCGMVCRDTSGQVLWGLTLVDERTWEAHVAEAVAVLEGLKEALRRGCLNIVMESDCLQVIEAIRKQKPGRSIFSLVIQDIILLSSSFNSILWSFTSRVNNTVAHALAHVVPRSLGRFEWSNVLPPIANSAVLFDLSSL